MNNDQYLVWACLEWLGIIELVTGWSFLIAPLGNMITRIVGIILIIKGALFYIFAKRYYHDKQQKEIDNISRKLQECIKK